MDVTLDSSYVAKAPRALSRTSALAVPAFASLGAGAIHAAAMGVHNEHHQAVLVFAAVAAFQLGWGALALTSNRLWLAFVGALGNAALVVGWALSKTSGIGFVDGLEESESLQWADGAAAGMAAVSVIGLVLWIAFGRRLPGSSTDFWSRAFFLTAIPIAVITVSAMISAASGHAHASGGHGAVAAADHPHGAEAAAPGPSGDGHGTHAATVAKPYDPTQPLDLSGTEGVTARQQAYGENLIASSLSDLPQWANPAAAEAGGWHSIGDSVTGYEHYVNRALMSDGKILDSDAPESLVYRVENGKKQLVAAMYMLEPGSTLENAPKPAGDLMQWHIHNNLCFTPTEPSRVAGLTDSNGDCRAPLVEGPHTPMVHVWIRSHPCGPFAALEGIAGGQIKEGESVLCDAAHGAHA